jgi:hypothetical protein
MNTPIRTAQKQTVHSEYFMQIFSSRLSDVTCMKKGVQEDNTKAAK